MKKKLVWLMAIMMGLSLLLTGCAGKSAAIGVVDLEKVMKDSVKIQGLQDQLAAKGKAIQEELDKDQKTMSKEDFDKKQQAKYGEFMQLRQELEAQVESSLKQAMEDVQKEKKLGAILYKQGVAQGGVDVTEDVLKKMN